MNMYHESEASRNIHDIDEQQARDGVLRELFGEFEEGSIAPLETPEDWGSSWTSYIDEDGNQISGIEAVRRGTEALGGGTYTDSFEDTVDDVLMEVADLIIERQRTYGPRNIEQQGIFGIVNRIGNDKLARIRQRLQGSIVNGEIELDDIELGSVDQPGIINDLADVIGYAVCGILLLRGEWGRPLAGDQ